MNIYPFRSFNFIFRVHQTQHITFEAIKTNNVSKQKPRDPTLGVISYALAEIQLRFNLGFTFLTRFGTSGFICQNFVGNFELVSPGYTFILTERLSIGYFSGDYKLERALVISNL